MPIIAITTSIYSCQHVTQVDKLEANLLDSHVGN